MPGEHPHARTSPERRSPLRFAWDSRYRIDVIIAEDPALTDDRSAPARLLLLCVHERTGWRRGDSVAA